MKIYQRFVKRLMDFVLALLGITLLSPLLLIIAVMVRMKLGKPILFQQERPGYRETVFTLKKFKTMLDKRGLNGDLLPDELRMTKFGKLLRETSLDELPELFHILKGEMSLVGPRPLLVQYLPLYNEHQKQRHNVRPGLTGLAQVNGRNAISWEEKFDRDVEYVNNITFQGDMKILFQTFFRVAKKDGINHQNVATMDIFLGSKK